MKKERKSYEGKKKEKGKPGERKFMYVVNRITPYFYYEKGKGYLEGILQGAETVLQTILLGMGETYQTHTIAFVLPSGEGYNILTESVTSSLIDVRSVFTAYVIYRFPWGDLQPECSAALLQKKG
eukprot:scaffold168116_cov17-Tisochrysis_lutea.AAC.1